MIYTVPFELVATSVTKDADKTICAIRAADTLGHQCRLIRLGVSCGNDTPVDRAVRVALLRVDDVSAGGAGTSTAVTPIPADSLSAAALITAGKNFTVEPTTYGIANYLNEINLRNTIDQIWTPDDGIIVRRDQLLGVVCAPRQAVAEEISGFMEFVQI